MEVHVEVLKCDEPYIEQCQLLFKKFLFCRPLRPLRKAFAGLKKSLHWQNFTTLWPVRSALSWYFWESRNVEYCCLAWVGVQMLLGYIRYKLHQYVGLLVFHLQLSWTLGSLLKLATLSLFYRYYFGRCSFEVVELVPLPHSCGRSTHYFHRFHYLSVTIITCYREVYVNCFFPDTTRLWNSLHEECFPLTFDLNSFNDKWLMRMFIYFCIHFNFRYTHALS